MHSLAFIIQPHFFLANDLHSRGSDEWERLVLGLNPPTRHCGPVVIRGKELHSSVIPQGFEADPVKGLCRGAGLLCWCSPTSL